jgi:hypothetical protein
LLAKNLLALGGLGVGVSLWVLACTSWFPVVGGLLGLGGAFAWFAFISGLLTEERKNQLRAEVERVVLLRPALWKRVGGTTLGLGLLASLFGTVELRSIRGEELQILQVRAAADSAVPDERDTEVLPPLGRSRRLVFTGWTGRAFRVRIAGLPSRQIDVGPIVPTRLTVPGSFERHPLVVIRADEVLTANASDPDRRYSLAVSLGRKVIGWLPEFRGNTVWVGCDADVLLPESLQERWRREVANPPLLWSMPLSLAPETVLAPGEKAEAWILRRAAGLKTGMSVASPLFRSENIVGYGSREITVQERIVEVVLGPFS